jgi:hypothetical protein
MSEPNGQTDEGTAEFRLTAAKVMATGRPSAGDDLLGMEMDFYGCLLELDEIDDDSLVVRRTSDPEGLILGTCRGGTGVSLETAVAAVRRAWLESLRYSYFEAHCVERNRLRATVHMLTQMGPDGLWVTASLDVLGNEP